MPYVDQKTRDLLDQQIDGLTSKIKFLAHDPGDMAGPLNYVCTRLACGLFQKRRYWTLALVIGVFVTVVLEYYRRWAAPYEDEKIKEHGDVFPCKDADPIPKGIWHKHDVPEFETKPTADPTTWDNNVSNP